METGILDLLLNGSPMVAFAGFLIYLYKTQQARMDNLVDRFQAQQERIRKEYKEDVSELRGRYDIVIANQNQEKDRIKDSIENRLSKLQNNLQSIHSTCQGIAVSQEVSKNQLDEISQNVEAGLTAIKDMQDQTKLREIAKQAIKDREP